MKKLCLSVTLLIFLSNYPEAQTQTSPPLPSAPRSVEYPKPVEQTLPNGLRVIVIERHNSPLVTASFVVKNGGEVDPRELAGLADITANLLTRGTTIRSATVIASELDGFGGSLESAAQWDASHVSVEVMSDKIGPAMEILADVVRRPTFKHNEIERLRQQYLDNLTLSLDEPRSIARFVAARVLYGDEPYGHPLEGTEESLKRISRTDILKLHRLIYRPDNAILVIGGDIKATAGFKLATRYFGDWFKPKAKVTQIPRGSAMLGSSRVVVIDKPDAGQAAVYLVRRGIERMDPDYYSGIVTNSVLSGYSGRLNQEIRIKRGLSYGAGSSLDPRRVVGPFVATAQTKNESAAIVADLLKTEITRLASVPTPDSELIPRKAALIGEFARELETVNGLVSEVSGLALYKLNLDEISHYIDHVQAVTSTDVEKFAAGKLDAKASDIIIVGNLKAFLPDLQKRYPDFEVIPFAELDLNTRWLRKKQPQ